MKIENASETEYTVSEIHLPNIHAQTFCVFDFEATGPDESEDHIIQIGALLLDGSTGEIAKTYKTLVKPLKPIPEVIERLTGIANKDVETAPDLSEGVQALKAFSEGAVMVTQAGYEFDWPLLQNECKRRHLPMLTNEILDTKVLFTMLYPEIKEVISTNFLIRFFRIDDSDIQRHDALGDSLLIGRIWIELCKECKKRKITDIHIANPLTIKKVQLQKLL